MENMFSLQGKVAIVTGGNGGIGKGIARGLAGMGADIFESFVQETLTL